MIFDFPELRPTRADYVVNGARAGRYFAEQSIALVKEADERGVPTEGAMIVRAVVAGIVANERLLREKFGSSDGDLKAFTDACRSAYRDRLALERKRSISAELTRHGA